MGIYSFMVQNYCSNNFEKFKSIVCEELINYYGEEYRDLILSRINDTNFTFYINPKYNEFLTYNLKKKKNYRSLKREYNRLQKELKNSDGIIYSSKKTNPALYLSTMYKNQTCFIYMCESGETKLLKEIFVPLFYASDESIIHEMIHSVMSSPLFLSVKLHGYALYYKFGIDSSNSIPGGLLEESFTEMDARIIARKLRERKVSLIDNFFLFDEEKCVYDNYILFIKRLYESFKDEINESRITLNNRRFIHDVGEENYAELINLLKNYYDNLYDCDKSFYKMIFDKCIDKMIERNDNKLVLRK